MQFIHVTFLGPIAVPLGWTPNMRLLGTLSFDIAQFGEILDVLR